MRTTSLLFVCCCLCFVGAGCSSIHTTHIKKNLDLCGWETKHLRGIPITLEVPHEYQVQVIERYYVTTDTAKLLKIGDEPVKTTYVKLDVSNTKEVFTVDFIKPGAGTLKTNADLDATNQYFTKIDNSIEDKTIDAIKDAIKTVVGALPPPAKGKSSGLMAVGDSTKVSSFDKTIAVGAFSVNDPNANAKIHEFLCRHLNGCTQPVCYDLGSALPGAVGPNTLRNIPVPAVATSPKNSNASVSGPNTAVPKNFPPNVVRPLPNVPSNSPPSALTPVAPPPIIEVFVPGQKAN